MAGPLVMDVHEPEAIAERLRALGTEPEVRTLHPGDYVLGPIGIERKTVTDFFASIVRQRLFDQVRRLREAYPKTLLLLEGDVAAIDEFRNPRAFWGAFLALLLDFETAIVFTAGHDQTAEVLHVLARRPESGEPYGLRYKPRMQTMEERQEFLVQGLPNVGQTLARNLLERFGSARAVLTADARELLKVPGIGMTRAAEIGDVLDAPWSGRQRRLADGE